ncbi:MAG: nucleoside deaminase [bacterium]
MMSRSQEQHDARFMDLALKQAEIALRKSQQPFGAVVVDRNGQVIGEGHNTVLADCDPTAHGEIVAIRNAWRRAGSLKALAGCTVYTSCEPCLMCTFVIAQSGIGRVVFAARGSDVPTYRRLAETDLAKVAAWVNTQANWLPIDVVGDFMRTRAVDILAVYPWPKP